jgi:hypothetical protein
VTHRPQNGKVIVQDAPTPPRVQGNNQVRGNRQGDANNADERKAADEKKAAGREEESRRDRARAELTTIEGAGRRSGPLFAVGRLSTSTASLCQGMENERALHLSPVVSRK